MQHLGKFEVVDERRGACQQWLILDALDPLPDRHPRASPIGQRYNVGLTRWGKPGDNAVKLTNEFTVGVPIERAWDTLLDIERVAGFLPGAKIESSPEQDVYHGSMRVKVGPMVVNYQGTARLVQADESQHTADIAVEARDTKGQGTASATIRNRLVPDSGGTRVIAETDLSITGRQAQFGRGIMQDVAGRMLNDFARRFEQYLLHGEGDSGRAAEPTAWAAGAPGTAPAAGAQGAATAAAGAGASDADAALDLGSVLFRTPAVQQGLAVFAALLLLLLLFRGRRR
jgi:carbon monoxide dehydrogenase subunit G